MADPPQDDLIADYTARQRKVWGLADYTALAERLAPAATTLIQLARPAVGEQVLDAAAGTGTMALLADAHGAEVTASDLSPRMVELGAARTRAADAAIRWLEADVEDLPLPSDSVDLALSSFGVIFVPRPLIALQELRRVLRPGGRLAFTAWTPDGFMGAMTELIRQWLRVPAHIPDPLDWARPDTVAGWLGTAGLAVDEMETETLPWRFGSGAEMTSFFRAHSPAHAAIEQSLGDGATELFTAIEQLASPGGGPVDIAAEYRMVLAG